jgi:colanic acid biosynthesis glycosyl transferase WcaI
VARAASLPNGADTDTLRPLRADDGFAQRLGVADRRVFTYAGTMASYQGLEVLVDVAERLRHRADIVILMIGTGPMKDYLVRAAEARGLSNILFRTSPFAEMSQLMSITTASLVVLRPLEISRKMRLSKAIPPMACAVPVIYAGWGETAELIAREQVGLTVEPGNPDEIALAITKLADDATLAKELGRRGRLLAEREFSWTFLVSDWVRQMELALNGQDPDVPAPRSTRAVPDRICAP